MKAGIVKLHMIRFSWLSISQFACFDLVRWGKD